MNSRFLLGPDSTAKQRSQFCQDVVSSWYDFIYDISLSLKADVSKLQKRIAGVSGDETYRHIRAKQKGAIILTAHMGSFEAGLVALRSVEEKAIHVVFQRDTFADFEKLRADFRKRMKIDEAPIDEGWGLWMRLRDALLRDEVVAVQGDRVMPGQKGMKVPMLGGHILLPTGPFKLASASGSPVIPIFSVRDTDGRIRICIEDAIEASADPQTITQSLLAFSKVLEKYLRQYPHQWLVLEPAFCENSSVLP